MIDQIDSSTCAPRQAGLHHVQEVATFWIQPRHVMHLHVHLVVSSADIVPCAVRDSIPVDVHVEAHCQRGERGWLRSDSEGETHEDNEHLVLFDPFEASWCKGSQFWKLECQRNM